MFLTRIHIFFFKFENNLLINQKIKKVFAYHLSFKGKGIVQLLLKRNTFVGKTCGYRVFILFFLVSWS